MKFTTSERTLAAMFAILIAVTASGCTGVTRNLGESDAEFAERQHEQKVSDVSRTYLMVDTAMNLAKSQGTGDEEFWEKYAEAKKAFNTAFAAWKAGDGADGDTIDKMMAILNALSAELAEAAD